MTTATLGIAVQSNAGTAAVDLDKLTAASGRAEAGVTRLAAASVKTAQATQQMSLNSANIAAQLQDVAVSAVAGMNGLQVGLQQGTQLSAVFQQLRASGQGVGAALTTAFASVISPVSLLTIGVVALATYGIQALGGIASSAATASEAIDEHAAKLGDIVQGYKDAQGAIHDWAEEAQRAPLEVVASNLSKAWRDAVREVEQFQTKSQNVSGSLFVLGGLGDDANAAIRSMREMLSLYATGQMSAQDLQIEMTKIANTDFGILNGNINDMARGLADGADKASALYSLYVNLQHAAAASGWNGGVATALDSMIESQRSATAHQIEMDALNAKTPAQQRDIAMRRERLKLVDQEITDALREQKVTEAGYLAFARSQASAGKSTTKDFDRFGNTLKNAQDRLATQQMEVEMFGQSTAALETMRVSQDLTNAAKAAGIDLNSQLAGSELTVAEAIAQTAEKTGAAAQEMERLQYQQGQIDALNNTLSSGFANLFIGIADGSKSAQESIGDLLSSLGKLLINQAFQNLFAPTAVGGGGFNPFGFLMGAGKASGGPVQAGMIYPVNENTPNTEYFAPAVNGTVLTAEQVNGARKSSGGVTVNAPITINGNADAMTLRDLGNWARVTLPGLVKNAVNDPYAVG